MPKTNKPPTPQKRFHGGRWRIIWKWHSKQYSLPTRFTDPKKSAAVDSDLRLISAALVMDELEFPDAYVNLPAAITYLADRYAENHDTPDSLLDPEKWLDDYEKELSGECSEKWAGESMVRLRAFEAAMNGIANATPKTVSSYLAGIIKQNSIPTRNRTQSILSRFFNWAVATHRTRVNPVKGTKKLKEERTSDIVYCTTAERDEIIALAQQTGWPEWQGESTKYSIKVANKSIYGRFPSRRNLPCATKYLFILRMPFRKFPIPAST